MIEGSGAGSVPHTNWSGSGSIALKWNLGWQRNFVPKKFRGIDLDWLPLFCGRKCSFRGIPRFTEESIPNGRKWHEKNWFYKKYWSSKENGQHVLSKTCFSTEFQEFSSIFSGIPSIFLLCSERNSESLLLCETTGIPLEHSIAPSIRLINFNNNFFPEIANPKWNMTVFMSRWKYRRKQRRTAPTDHQDIQDSGHGHVRQVLPRTQLWVSKRETKIPKH